MGTGRVRSASSSTRPAIPYCVTLGLTLAHLLSGPCQLLNYQLVTKGQEKEDEEVEITQALGKHAHSQERAPTLPSHMSSLPLSGLRKGRRKEKFQLSFPEATEDESWCLLFLKVVGEGGHNSPHTEHGSLS